VTTLDDFRRGASKLFLRFLWANLAVLFIVVLWRQDDSLPAIVGIGLAMCVASSLIVRKDPIGFTTRVATSLVAVAFPALFLAAARGSAVIVDVHMYFFACLAIAAAWCCWRSLVIAAGFIALHHLILDYAYPTAVFPEASNLGRVALHAGVVIVEVAALSLVTQRLCSAFEVAQSAIAQAATSREEALQLADQQRQIADHQIHSQNVLLEELAGFQSRVARHLAALRKAGGKMSDAGFVLKKAVAQSNTFAARAADASKETADGIATIQSTTTDIANAIGEIERRMSETTSLLRDSARKSSVTERQASELIKSIDRVSQFAATIRAVAARTNLLALNATIESARAGEAGRGFAVVAGEVKSLADATAKATADIQTKVAEIKAIASSTGGSVTEMAASAAGIDAHATVVAEALRQQHSATSEIARVMRGFASNAAVMKESIGEASRAASDTADLAAVADQSSQSVQNVADMLHDELEQFLAGLKFSQRLSA
jgi:methyl-accepting chemotaxis protein